MKKIILGVFVLALLLINTNHAKASIVDDLLNQIKSLRTELSLLKANQGASVLDASADTTPRIMYWSGKVNQHIDASSVWQTDPDGKSGATIDKLTYCKKWFPNTVSVQDYMYETISTWRAGGNTGAYSSTKMSTKCVQKAVSIPNRIATVTSSAPTNITYNGAIITGNVTDLGVPASVSARGVCFKGYGQASRTDSSSTCVPATGLSQTVGGSFTVNLTGRLSPSTSYSFITYADHQQGPAQSSQRTFSTPAKPVPINGGWSNWVNSGSCVDGLQTQTRTCTNPTPANGGAQCVGVSTQKVSCNTSVSSCNQKDFTAALIFVTKDISNEELNKYKEMLSYIKNRFPWAFNFATSGLATMSIPDQPVILNSNGLLREDKNLDFTATMKKFYESNSDNYDFVYIFTNTGFEQQIAYGFAVNNNINGIGMEIFDTSSLFGSKGRLMNISYYSNQLNLEKNDREAIKHCFREQKNNFNPLIKSTSCGMQIMLHETAHQWGIFVGDIVENYNPSMVDLGIQIDRGTHYYYGLSSPEGINDPLGQTVFWKKAPDDSVYLDMSQESDLIKYHPFTLYLMGLLPENQYDIKYDLLQNIGFSNKYNRWSMESIYKQVSVRDIIAKEGPRTCVESIN